MIDKPQSRNPYHALGQPPKFLRSVCLYMDMLGYKDMWWRAEQERQQDNFLSRLYAAFEEGQTMALAQ